MFTINTVKKAILIQLKIRINSMTAHFINNSADETEAIISERVQGLTEAINWCGAIATSYSTQALTTNIRADIDLHSWLEQVATVPSEQQQIIQTLMLFVGDTSPAVRIIP